MKWRPSPKRGLEVASQEVLCLLAAERELVERGRGLVALTEVRPRQTRCGLCRLTGDGETGGQCSRGGGCGGRRGGRNRGGRSGRGLGGGDGVDERGHLGGVHAASVCAQEVLVVQVGGESLHLVRLQAGT